MRTWQQLKKAFEPGPLELRTVVVALDRVYCGGPSGSTIVGSGGGGGGGSGRIQLTKTGLLDETGLRGFCGFRV